MNTTVINIKTDKILKKDAQRLADDFEMADTTARQQVRAFIKDKHDGIL